MSYCGSYCLWYLLMESKNQDAAAPHRNELLTMGKICTDAYSVCKLFTGKWHHSAICTLPSTFWFIKSQWTVAFYFFHNFQKGPGSCRIADFLLMWGSCQFIPFILLMCVMKIKLLPPSRFSEEQSVRTISFRHYTKAMWLTFKGLYDVTGSSLAFGV